MTRTFYLHVGPRKTATSAIQDFLQNHDNSVVVYPKVGLVGPGSHHGLMYRFFDKSHNGKAPEGDDLDCMFEKIEQEAMNSDRDVVISSETFELDWADAGRFVQAILPHLSRSPMNVEIVLACREHFARAASWYNHRMRALHGGQQRNLPDEFLSAHAEEVCYAPMVRRLRETGYKVTAMDYHPSDTWTDRFLSYIGFPKDQLPTIRMRHIALSPKVLIAKVATNRAVKSKEVRAKYLNAFTKKLSESRTPSKFIFGRECATKTDRLFREDRNFLAEEFGIQLTPPDLGSIENMFFINREEFDEIATVAESLGAEGKEITRFARQYIRETADA